MNCNKMKSASAQMLSLNLNFATLFPCVVRRLVLFSDILF